MKIIVDETHGQIQMQNPQILPTIGLLMALLSRKVATEKIEEALSDLIPILEEAKALNEEALLQIFIEEIKENES